MAGRVVYLPALLVLVTTTLVGAWINPGTPQGVPESFNCAGRKAAWEYGRKLLPSRGSFRTLFDALQLQNCGLTPPTEWDHWTPPVLPTPAGNVVHADAHHGSDNNPGTAAAPVKTLKKAVDVAATKLPATILLHEGVYHTSTIDLTPSHSGLHIQNAGGAKAVISGGVPLRVPKASWSVHRRELGWRIYNNSNNVYGRAVSRQDSACCKYLGTFQSLTPCEQAVNTSTKGPFGSFTWHSPQFGGDFAGQCFGVVGDSWQPTTEPLITSGRHLNTNVWVTSAVNNITTAPGLRKGSARMIRAKYPNGNPELSGEWFQVTDPGMGGGIYSQGWVSAPTKWLPPRSKPAPTNIVVTGKDWPSVEWPMVGPGGTTWTGEGDWGEYHLGMGGTCDDLDPPYGYWCSSNAPRKIQAHMSPQGLNFGPVLPNAPYKKPQKAVVHAWRGAGRWYTWACVVESQDTTAKTFTFSEKEGCNQGGEGENSGQEWWIENVLEECDAPDEYFFDEEEKKLYIGLNGTGSPTGMEEWVVPQTKILFNIVGTQQNPVKDISIRGVQLRDTRYTFTDPQGMPSGGDWAIQRQGAIFIEGTEKVNIDGNELTRLDGIGVFISGYNRNVSLTRNDFNWIGDSAIASWGYTGHCLNEDCSKKVPYKVGPDGRGGEQPHGTLLEGNLVRELGIYQKQSSFYFQAVTQATVLKGNVHFNSPRAGINFNDGFGGGDLLEHNLLINCVRESGDHGPFNSWDRVPYITTHRTGKPSIIPKDRLVRKNFIIATYSSQLPFDTDDGSSYYNMTENFFLFPTSGMKNDFGGHDHRQYGNIYAYTADCFGKFTCCQAMANDKFYNNTCILRPGGTYHSDCKPYAPNMEIHSNLIGTQDGKMEVCGVPFSKWQSEGHDPGTRITGWPSDDAIIAQAKNLLGF